MMDKFWDLPNPVRRERVEALRAEGKSDIERWLDPLNADGAMDHSRSITTARYITPGSSVLDIGCGAMVLKNYLPEGCSYTPCDLVDRGNGCIVADLNKGEFPTGFYDYVTVLGVLEYIYDVPLVLSKLRKVAKNLLLDYNSQNIEAVHLRRNCGWVSDLKPGEVVSALIAADWKLINLLKVVNDRYFYICSYGA